MTARDAEITVVCYARAPMLLDPVDAHVETLQRCDSDGTVDAVLLRSWPERVALTDGSPHPEVVDAFERFERWADRRNVSVRPPFEVRTTTSVVTEETRDVLVTPLLCLAIYRGESLVGVFPYTADGTTHTATDAIATLRSGELPTPPDVQAAPRPRQTCPECDGPLLQGQGVLACDDCHWTGTIAGDGRDRHSVRGSPERPAVTGRRTTDD